MRSRLRVALFGLGAVLALGGCVTLLAASGDSPQASEVVVEPAEPMETGEEAVEDTETVSGDDASPAEPLADDPSGDVGPQGTRQAPLPYDQPTELVWSTVGDADGSVWATTIGPPRDITDEVLAANQFNDPPPEGIRFVGFDATLTLIDASTEPLAPSFNFNWEVLGGATARVYNSTTIETESFGCGVTANGFDDFAEVFAGGTLSGTVCIPLPAEDLDHPDTRVALKFASGDRAIFGP